MQGSEGVTWMMDDLLVWNVDTKDEHLILELLSIVTQRALEEMYARVNGLPLKSIGTSIKGSLDIEQNS